MRAAIGAGRISAPRGAFLAGGDTKSARPCTALESSTA
jgi:hypothetical protein